MEKKLSGKPWGKEIKCYYPKSIEIFQQHILKLDVAKHL